MLVCITYDGVVYWYEGLILFIVYFLYFTVMFQNERISKYVKGHFKKNNKVQDITKPVANNNERCSVVSAYGSYMEEPPHTTADDLKKVEAQQDKQEEGKIVAAVPN